jgi:hypothetical protein
LLPGCPRRAITKSGPGIVYPAGGGDELGGGLDVDVVVVDGGGLEVDVVVVDGGGLDAELGAVDVDDAVPVPCVVDVPVTQSDAGASVH